MKIYSGDGNPRECEYAVYVREGNECHELDPRLDLRNHSPTGLSWGYGGSGPAQCALAILADYFGDEVALRNYQHFKATVVAKLPASWTLDETYLNQWIGECGA